MKKNENMTPDEVLEYKIEKVQRRREWKRFFVEFILIAAVLYALFNYVIGIAFVSGTSMDPGLKDGELVLFYRLDKEYQEDDIIIIHREGKLEYIKRVVGLPGDVVDFDGEGNLLRNGAREIGDYIFSESYPLTGDIEFPYDVPEDSYFVLGDNRANSKDSRVFGAVKTEEVTGRVFLHLGLAG